MKKKALPPLIIPAICWFIGLISASYIQMPLKIAFLLFAAVMLLFFIARLRTAVILIAIILLAHIRVSIEQKYPPNHISNIINQYSPIIQPVSGKIVTDVQRKEGKYSFILQLKEIGNHQVTGRIRFSSFQAGLQYGDEISTVGKISKIKPPSNPYSFDYEKTMHRRKIFGIGYALAPISVHSNSGSFFQKQIIIIRNFLLNRIESRFERHADFVKAIVLGDKANLDSTRKLLNKAGLSHILAVSGLHVGMIYLILFNLFLFFIRYRNPARILVMITLIFYGGICNWSASVFRAVIMINLMLIGMIIQRKVNSNNILAASFIIITAIVPSQLVSAGFQMSFLAVFTLLNILPNLRFISIDKSEIKAMKMGKKLLNSILILMLSSLILNLALAPVTMLHFKQFGFNGIIGNLLGILLIGFILPIAFLVILLPQVPILISIYHNSFFLLMTIFEKWSQFAAGFPFHYDFIAIDQFQFILLYLILGLLFINLRKIRSSLISIVSRFLLIGAVFCFVIVTLKHDNKFLIVTFFDCGLGDLILIETPQNETIMIDTGPPDGVSGSFNQSTLPYLQSKGIRKLDWLLITHSHNDHYGGYKEVFAALEISNLAVTDEFQDRDVWLHIEETVHNANCQIHTITDTITVVNNCILFKIIHPDPNFSNNNKNNMSIVSRLDYHDLSILFTGDLEHEGEHHLICNYYSFLDCDVLKVGHHGSKTASNIAFIEAVSPDFAFISTPLQNRFDFPHSQTLNTLEFLENNLFISGRDGALQITTNGQAANFKTYLSEVDCTIILTD